MNTENLFTLYYAAKAYAGAVVTAVTGVILAVEAALSDKAISLDEANGVIMLVTAAVGVVATFGSVWKTRNKGMEVR